MKNLDDFCAEVHRRHDEAKKLQKKQRKAFAMTCIPFILVFGLIFYPGLMRAESKDAATENLVGSTAIDTEYKITALQGETVTVLEAGSRGAKQISSLFFKGSLDHTALEDGADLKPKEESAIDSSTQSSQEKDTITFVFTDGNGKNIRFILEDQHLIRLDTGEERILLEEERDLLYNTLKKETNE